ncbi:MAG: TolC family protein, partial [Gemmatimonas sp.]
RPVYLQARTSRDLSYVRLKQLLNLPLTEQVSLVDDVEQQAGLANAAQRPPAPISQELVVNPADLTATDPRVTQAVNAVVATSDTTSGARAPVRQASVAVEIAQQQLKATKAQRLPSLGLNTTYQRLAYPSDGIPRSLGDFFPNWTVGVGVSFPFFTGGRVKGETIAAEAGVVEAQQRLQQATDAATLDAQQSVMQLQEAEEAWQASIGTTEQANRAYSIAEVRFREGLSTQVELSESRVQLQQAQANRARAARDLQVARVRMRLLRDLPLGASGMGGANAGAAQGGAASGAGAMGGAAPSQGQQRTGQTGAPSPTGTP